MTNRLTMIGRGDRIKGEEGFTLIELAVALAILGILVAIAVPTYLNVRDRAYDAEAKQVLGEIRSMAWSHFLEMGEWPSDMEELGYQDAVRADADSNTYRTERWDYALVGDEDDTEIDVTATGVADEPSEGRNWTLTLDDDGTSTLVGP